MRIIEWNRKGWKGWRLSVRAMNCLLDGGISSPTKLPKEELGLRMLRNCGIRTALEIQQEANRHGIKINPSHSICPKCGTCIKNKETIIKEMSLGK